MTVPKYKREIRKAIIQNVERNKSVFSLRRLYIITDIEKRACDDELCRNVEKKEWFLWSSIHGLLKCDEKEIGIINRFIHGLLNGKRKRNNKTKALE